MVSHEDEGDAVVLAVADGAELLGDPRRTDAPVAGVVDYLRAPLHEIEPGAELPEEGVDTPPVPRGEGLDGLAEALGDAQAQRAPSSDLAVPCQDTAARPSDWLALYSPRTV